jgi:hypothetical protein
MLAFVLRGAVAVDGVRGGDGLLIPFEVVCEGTA